jgi:hypothetical protein
MQKILSRIVSTLVGLYRQYPARSNALIISGVVAVAGFAGIVVSPQSVGTVLAVIIPILLGGELTHHKVTPVS